MILDPVTVVIRILVHIVTTVIVEVNVLTHVARRARVVDIWIVVVVVIKILSGVSAAIAIVVGVYI